MPSDTNASQAAPTGPISGLHVCFVGVGRAGLRALELVAQTGLPGAEYLAVDTDAAELRHVEHAECLLVGAQLARGLGSGGDPAMGRAAGESEAATLQTHLAGRDLVIILAGLGGGTGSGVAPVVGRVAREANALTLALATLPFDFEGPRRHEQATRALQELKAATDAVICLPNDRLAHLLDDRTPLADTFKHTDRMWLEGVLGLWRLMSANGLIKVDFAHVYQAVRGRQAESLCVTVAGQGEHRVQQVLDQLRQHPLLDGGRWLAEADTVLVNLTGGRDFSLKEARHFSEQLSRGCEEAQIILGANVDEATQGGLSVFLIAARRQAPVENLAPRSLAIEETVASSAEFPVLGVERRSESPELSTPRRPEPRIVPPAPELPPQRVEELLLRQENGSSPRQRKKAQRMRQGMLPLEVVSKNRFARTEATIYRGEDLDTPTFLRRGMVLN